MAATRDELPLGRLEAFSDGVFAIAITLLVLELAVAPGAGEHLFRSILHEWPAYLAYATSFMTIGVIWLQHSAITSTLRAADSTLYRLNLLVLFFASFLPFPTKLVAEFIRGSKTCASASGSIPGPESARKALILDRIEQAEEDGQIDEDRADELKDDLNDAELPGYKGGFGLGGFGFGFGPGGHR